MTTVARVTGPADLAASVPEVLGFTPTESLVVLSLHEPRGRLGLTMRFDLSAAEVFEHEVPTRLAHDGATRTALLVYTDQPGALACADLVHRLIDVVQRQDITVSEALLVREGTWWSYLCQQPCCPVTGSPVADAGTGAAGLVAAERVFAGRMRFATREQLEASLRPVLPLGEQARLAQLDEVAADLLDEVVQDRAEVVRSEMARVRAALDSAADPGPDRAARLAIALRLAEVRDGLTACIPDRADQVRSLMTAVLRWTPHQEAGCVLRVLGTAAYAQGEGALARIALRAAAAADGPGTFADTLLEALDRQVPPSVLRASLSRSAKTSQSAKAQTRLAS